MRIMKITTIAVGAACALAPGMALADISPEVLTRPIAGVEDSRWFDYRSDVLEAEHELRSDLADADDEGDVFDARTEFHAELADALHDYRKEMIERGYPVGRVTLGAD